MVEFQHVKPGKGGAFVRSKLRNVRTGAVLDRTFNAGVKVEQAILDKRDMQFLYSDGTDYVFMDTDTYDQMTVPPTALGDAVDYLVESMVAMIATYNDEIVQVELPASVELEIGETEPGIQGDRVSGARKPATLVTAQGPSGVVRQDRGRQGDQLQRRSGRGGRSFSRAARKSSAWSGLIPSPP